MLNNKEICLWLIGYPGVYLYVTFCIVAKWQLLCIKWGAEDEEEARRGKKKKKKPQDENIMVYPIS